MNTLKALYYVASMWGIVLSAKLHPVEWYLLYRLVNAF